MKNVLVIDTDGEKLVSSINDGTNRLFINDNEIDSSLWVGSGNYTDTVNGHAITITKVANLNGNIIIDKVNDYDYQLLKAVQGYYLYQDENGNVNITGALTINGQILFDTTLTDIRGLYSDGEYRDILQAPNTNNNVVLGYGGYKDGIGNTNIYGNKINFQSNDGFSISDAAAFRNALGASNGIFPISLGGSGQDNSTSLTTIGNIITVNSSVATITAAQFAQWGKIGQLYINWTNKSAISVPASGNITNVTIGTLVSGKRPKIESNALSSGDNAGAAWYNIATGGAIGLGACEGTGTARTIAAGTTFRLYSTFILA